MAVFGVKGALLPAGDAVCSSAKELLAHFDTLAERERKRLDRAGIKAYLALGIHPARIPWHGVEEILAGIPHRAASGRLVAIGDIGLEKGGEREEQVFLQQLELASELNLPVLVHTPERDKLRITRRTLALLRESGLAPQSVLVGHANAKTVRLIRECDFFAGLSISPTHLQAQEAVRLVRELGSEGLIISSDAGDGTKDILALARTASLLEEAGLSPIIVRRTLGANALAFLRLDRELLSGSAA